MQNTNIIIIILLLQNMFLFKTIFSSMLHVIIVFNYMQIIATEA
jgi:hypothetical protein